MWYGKKKIGIVIVSLLLLVSVKVYRWSRGTSALYAGLPLKEQADISYGLPRETFIPLPKASRYRFLDGNLENISFEVDADNFSAKKIVRHGTFLKIPGARATIVMCHGFMCDKKDIGIIRMLLRGGKYQYNILSFDFRGHGENTKGQACTMGKHEIHDIFGAVSYIKSIKEIKKLPIIGYGFSMGAVSLIQAQGNYHSFAEKKAPFDALVLDCPFDSSDTILKRVLERLKVSVLGYQFGLPAQSFLHKYFFSSYIQSCLKFLLRSSSKFEAQNVTLSLQEVLPYKSAQNISVPSLVITCSNDEKVPLESVENVYKNIASTYKELWITNGRRHFDSLFYNPEAYTYRVLRFIEKFIEKKFVHKHAHKIYTDIPDSLTTSIAASRTYAKTKLSLQEVESCIDSKESIEDTNTIEEFHEAQ